MIDGLAPPWPEVLELTWESYRAGTVPVGALLVDESGDVVARGRNRIFDVGADAGIAGTRLAHAEVNALLALPPERTHEELTLYTPLEPCHLCVAAAIAVRLGTVRYASRDPYGGAVGKLVPSVDHLAHPVAFDGPLAEEVERFVQLLQVAHFLWRRPDGDVVRYYRETNRELVAEAAGFPAPDAAVSDLPPLRHGV